MNPFDVLAMRQVAYVMSQVASALARIEGMKAENMQREHHGESIAYGEEAFEGVISDFGLGHNAVLTTLSHGQ